jgi:DNA-binding PadR family transcriptional regulator
MALTGPKKEMLFILGEFFRETSKRFSKTPLQVSVSKAEFIDNIREIGVVAKQHRAVYRNLEALENERYIVYDEKKNLRITRKGLNEYVRVLNEFEQLRTISEKIHVKNIQFRRKQQTKLR